MMTRNCFSKKNPDKPILYEIRVEGILGTQWTDWFGGMTISHEENGQTVLAGAVVDQAALHGLLKMIRDLSLPLVSVNRIDDAESAANIE